MIDLSALNLNNNTIENLNNSKIYSVLDLFNFFPKKYDCFVLDNLITIPAINETYFLECEIKTKPSIKYFSGKKSFIKMRVAHNSNHFGVTIFNQPFHYRKLEVGKKVYLRGKFNNGLNDFVVSKVLFNIPDNKIKPLYGIKGVTDYAFSKIVSKAFANFNQILTSPLPSYLEQKYKLVSFLEAYNYAHFPSDLNAIKQFKRRIKYEELFCFQYKLQKMLGNGEDKKGVSIQVNDELITKYIDKLPYELTVDQKKATEDILADLRNQKAMNRVIQGDVGCGKTVVSAISTYAVVLSKMQTAFMAPTEILAKQQFESFKKTFNHLGIEVELLTSNVKGKKRKEILGRLKQGEIDVLVGTHALTTQEVEFENLALVIVDEQHRFGVNQRKTLSEKGDGVNVLYLTATPIPRTLALSLFKEVDITTIKTMPSGRKPVETYLVPNNKKSKMFGFIEKELINKKQAYFVTPLVEESDKLDLENAENLYNELVEVFGPNYKVGLLHGKLKDEEKNTTMNLFKENKINVLVSTTVIEVGVNVPNATIMVVVDAHRFGLSQLHQLRGRVGRGEFQSYCLLLSDATNVKNNERLKAMEQTTDGFVLSEIDLKQRGPGDFFGVNQSGLPSFNVADLNDDFKIMEIARDDVDELLTKKVEQSKQVEQFFQSEKQINM